MAKRIDNTNVGRLVSDIKAKADNSYWPKDQTTEVDLATVATTGSYNDLTDKPTVAGGAVIYVGTCDTAAATAEKTVTVTTFPIQNGKPVVGTVIGVLYSNTNSASNVTLNVNSTGAESIYYTAAVYTSTSSIVCGAKNRYVYYVWDGTYWVWLSQSADADTNTIAYTIRTSGQKKTMTDACGRYRIIFSSVDGTQWVPPTTDTTTNATSARAVNTRKIDPFGPIMYYSTTTALSAGGAPNASYLQEQAAAITLGYSFNRTGAALVLTEQAPVYIKCAPQSDGSAIIDADNPYVQAMPSTNDGKIYIYLGVATSAIQIEMVLQHPVYYHDGSGIRVWTGKEIPAAVEANPTVPSGTTPTALSNLKVGNGYYSVGGGSPVTISTDIASDKADNTKAGGAKAIYDFVKPASQSSIPQGGLLPGIKYHLGILTGSVTMTLASPADASVENEYKGDFTADSTPPVITWPGVTEWAGNCLDDQTGLPLLTGGKHYEFNIESGYGFIAEFGV